MGDLVIFFHAAVILYILLRKLRGAQRRDKVHHWHVQLPLINIWILIIDDTVISSNGTSVASVNDF